MTCSIQDVFIICFSVADLDSFDNVLEKWHPEVIHYCPKVPIVLVGTKVDMREDKEVVARLLQAGKHLVTKEKVRKLIIERKRMRGYRVILRY